ncbi:hypothetical protein CP533_0613 [Ophiocordyceps camponoti-saundersi (nom. inval.)]|nr:hypothetical protein CP533_0613 [Ophiocordyceps camponoti-saundersi (nom. inval.)]
MAFQSDLSGDDESDVALRQFFIEGLAQLSDSRRPRHGWQAQTRKSRDQNVKVFRSHFERVICFTSSFDKEGKMTVLGRVSGF